MVEHFNNNRIINDIIDDEFDEYSSELIDNNSSNTNGFILCNLHQAKTMRERWKFFYGSVPANVSVRLNRLESLLSLKEENKRKKTTLLQRSQTFTLTAFDMNETTIVGDENNKENNQCNSDPPTPLQNKTASLLHHVTNDDANFDEPKQEQQLLSVGTVIIEEAEKETNLVSTSVFDALKKVLPVQQQLHVDRESNEKKIEYNTFDWFI